MQSCPAAASAQSKHHHSAGASHPRACAKPLQSCLTLCNPMDHSPPGSSVRGMLPARILERLPLPPLAVFPPQGWKPRVFCLCIGSWVLYRERHLGSLSADVPRSLSLPAPGNHRSGSMALPFLGIPHKWTHIIRGRLSISDV